MEKSIIPTQGEEHLVKTIIDNGTSVINGQNIDDVILGLIKVDLDVFNLAWNKICQDDKVRKDIFNKLNKSIDEVVVTSDEQAKNLISSLDADSDFIKRIMSERDYSAEEEKQFILLLREYAHEKVSVFREAQAAKQRMIDAKMKASTNATPKGSKAATVVGVVAGVGGLSALGYYLWRLFKK